MIDKKIPLYVLSLHARKTVYNIRNICAINKMLKTCSKNDNTYNLFGRKLLHKYVKHAMLVSVFSYGSTLFSLKPSIKRTCGISLRLKKVFNALTIARLQNLFILV